LDVLELRVADDLVELANGAVDVACLAVIVENELRLGAVEARVRLRCGLEILACVRVLAAALVGETGVVERLGEGTIRRRELRFGRLLEGARERLARRLGPIALLVVIEERLERLVEARGGRFRHLLSGAGLATARVLGLQLGRAAGTAGTAARDQRRQNPQQE